MNKKHEKLIQAHQNNIEISDKKLGDKYTYFEDSKLDESRSLLYEINNKPTNFKRYSRGMIVKVKFGVNIGSEFSGDHYAIVISKKDTMMNPILHVIPLTSKRHNYNIKLDNLLYDKEKINNLKSIFEYTDDNKEKRKLKGCIKYYENRKNKSTYACVKHLKTISKLSICRPINKYDYLDQLKVSNETLKLIDQEIIKEYTLF
jgi:hypothetical protein